MGCARINLRSLGRKTYPLVRQNTPRLVYMSGTDFEIETLIVEIIDDNRLEVVFEKPFTQTPSVVASLITPSPSGGPNIYVETATPNGAVIRSSANVTGKIHVHALWIEGCGA